MAALVAAVVVSSCSRSDVDLAAPPSVAALNAAGAFGRGANAAMIRSVRSVAETLTNNLLGFVGATLVLVILGLAAGHIYGDERAHEKTLRVVKGVFMLVAATGLVA
ncbi:hypothetical protein VSS74_16335 [Conexibacter stalactiti]|uniref:TrbC/VIRB2 family protein n=1 Tax=Conexibacter stalactiti TaxID=1940611 RepID=A0ABU4HRL8_9ACTN|nr:hypothetical protein [Conexibacter stalactiti]MDW5595918.1 hypothetical protein [Conexibacter stalactiti]MEC5036560.1 hypothetical protein [Conexibacter stalactiti]